MKRLIRRLQCWLGPDGHPGFQTTLIYQFNTAVIRTQHIGAFPGVLYTRHRLGINWRCTRCGEPIPEGWQ